jgi:hypothetical protein
MMSVLLIAGILAIVLGLILLFMGDVGHSPVKFNLREGSLLGQAWLLVLLLGFLLLLIDQFMVWRVGLFVLVEVIELN